MKSEEFKQLEKILSHSIENLIKDYKNTIYINKNIKDSKRQHIEFLLNHYEAEGYDLTKQKIKYQDLERDEI